MAASHSDKKSDCSSVELFGVLVNYGDLVKRLGKLEEAQEVILRALKSGEEDLGLEHPDILCTLTELGDIHRLRRNFSDAETWCLEAIKGWEQNGLEHENILRPMYVLALVYWQWDRLPKAEEMLQKASTRLYGLRGPVHEWTTRITKNLREVKAVMSFRQDVQSLCQSRGLGSICDLLLASSIALFDTDAFLERPSIQKYSKTWICDGCDGTNPIRRNSIRFRCIQCLDSDLDEDCFATWNHMLCGHEPSHSCVAIEGSSDTVEGEKTSIIGGIPPITATQYRDFLGFVVEDGIY